MSDGNRTRARTVITAIPKVSDRPVTKEACLVVIYGRELGQKISLNRKQVIVGRSSKADIQIDEEAVSRNHCQIIHTDNVIMLRDMGSTNGTYVNNEVIDEYVLRDGDFIKVGRCIFKFLSGNNIENAYHEEIYRLTTVDRLTQVFNRRHLVETVEREISRARRYRRDLALIMLDIDRFKDVNDSFGNLAGDHVLKHLASALKTRIRHEFMFARYGGDEFAIVLPEIDGYNAMQFAEKIRKLVEVAEFKFQGMIIPVTVSIGVAHLRDTIEDTLEFIKQAAINLLAAKEGGRNRVIGETEARALLPHSSIKPMLAFREAIIRSSSPTSVLLALRTWGYLLPHQNGDAMHLARRRLEDVVFAALGGTDALVGRGNDQVLLLATKGRDEAERAQREITSALASEETAEAARISVAFGPPIAISGDIASVISMAIDFVPSGSSSAVPDWIQQLVLPLGILVRNLFLTRDRAQRYTLLARLHEGITRWLLLWLWSELCNLEQLEHGHTRLEQYTDNFKQSISIGDALALLRAAVQKTSGVADRLQSQHAWHRLFADELDTLRFLSECPVAGGNHGEREGCVVSEPGASDVETKLLQILREMTLIALPIVPAKNEHISRTRFEGSAEMIIGDNSVVATDLVKLSTPVKTGQLYLFAPSSTPISLEPFARYDHCHDCGTKELFIAESINTEGKYVYWSPSTNHSITGRTFDDARYSDNTPPIQTHLITFPDILIITTQEQDRDALLARLSYETLPKDDDDVGIFYRAEIATTKRRKIRLLVTMLQGMGPLQANTRAMYATMRWQPRYVFMIGTVRGISGATALGDVIVANQIAANLAEKVTGREVRKTHWEPYKADAALLEATNAFLTGWEGSIGLARPGAGLPRRHIGVIASGPYVGAYKARMKRYAKNSPKLLGVELEGEEIATALHQSPRAPGILTICGVSDYADDSKSSPRVKKWRPYAAQAAAAYAVGLIQSGFISGHGVTKALIEPPCPEISVVVSNREDGPTNTYASDGYSTPTYHGGTRLGVATRIQVGAAKQLADDAMIVQGTAHTILLPVSRPTGNDPPTLAREAGGDENRPTKPVGGVDNPVEIEATPVGIATRAPGASPAWSRKSMRITQESAAPVFICYARADNEAPHLWLDRLLQMIEPLNKRGVVRPWTDNSICIGEQWNAEIQHLLATARAAVLLVSPAFMASPYVHNSELPVLLRRAHDERGLQIFPVLLRPSLFHEVTFRYPDPVNGPNEMRLADFQAANPSARTLSEMTIPEQDRVLLRVAKELSQLAAS